MLRIAHSNIEKATPERPKQKPVKVESEFSRQMRYKYFKKACKEQAARIEEIQKYFPGWEPTF